MLSVNGKQCCCLPNYSNNSFSLKNFPHVSFHTYELEFLKTYQDNHYFIINDVPDELGIYGIYFVNEKMELFSRVNATQDSEIITVDDKTIEITHCFE